MPRRCLSRTNTLTLSARRKRLAMHQKRRITRLAQQARLWPWLRGRAADGPVPQASGTGHRLRQALARRLQAEIARADARFPFLGRWWHHVRIVPAHHLDDRYPRGRKSKIVRSVLCRCWLLLVAYSGVMLSNVVALFDDKGVEQPMHNFSEVMAAVLTHTGARAVEQQPAAGGMFLSAVTLILGAAIWANSDLRCEKEVVQQRGRHQLKAEARSEAREEARQAVEQYFRAYGGEPPPDFAVGPGNDEGGDSREQQADDGP